jgi:DNA helicase-2/ATP-dependent DNA helicase PcrA
MARESRAAAGWHRSPGDEQPASPVGLPVTLARLADEHALEFPDASVGEFLEWVFAGGEGDMELEAADGVELSTFHRAKGLEWPAVAVVGLENGMVPIAYATTPDALAEERRLLYVALTRAEDELWCSWAGTRRSGDRTWRCEPSPLLGALQKANHELGARSEPDPRRLARRIALLRARLPDAG